MKRISRLITFCTALSVSFLAYPQTVTEEGEWLHGLSLYGPQDLKYPKEFQHLDYVNPNAPKSGKVHFSGYGTFDTLNPNSQGPVSAIGLSLTSTTLMASSLDEPMSAYCLVCDKVRIAPDGTSVTFSIREGATFHDGVQITPETVAWTMDVLKDTDPRYHEYYVDVVGSSVEENTVTFHFRTNQNRELPNIVGQLVVLPMHYWQPKMTAVVTEDDPKGYRAFTRATDVPPTGSGPYRVSSFSMGKSIQYERVKNWWGRNLPVVRGHYNFDTVVYTYFRDFDVMRQQFTAGGLFIHFEFMAQAWAEVYKGDKLDDGAIIKELFPDSTPNNMQGFIFNTRRLIFSDPLTRRALTYAFNFEGVNSLYMYSSYIRSESFWNASELGSSGLLDDVGNEKEREILDNFVYALPQEVYTEEYTLPVYAEGSRRKHLMEVVRLLRAADWSVKVVDGKRRMIHSSHRDESGKPLELTWKIVLRSPGFKRIALAYAKDLEQIGIKVSVQVVDAAQYSRLVDNFEYDMIVGTFPASLSPGNELRSAWSSASANVVRSRNFAGVENPAIDSLVDLVIAASTREDLIASTRALDRALLWGHYVIPQWYLSGTRVVRWDIFGLPQVTPKYGMNIFTWWIDPDKLTQRRRDYALK